MGKNKTEQLFAKVAREAGLQVHPPRPIRIESPVESRRGELTKVVTTPDFYVVEPDSGQSAHVEVTNGSGNNEHKQAQKRVVEAAGVNNYVVLTGDQVASIDVQVNAYNKRALLIAMLGWYQIG